MREVNLRTSTFLKLTYGNYPDKINNCLTADEHLMMHSEFECLFFDI